MENPCPTPPHRTAIKRSGKPPAPVIDMLKHGMLHGKILDFGCGHGDAVRFLRDHGLMVDGFDPHAGFGFPMPDGQFDIVYSTYVVNVIEDPQARLGAVAVAWEKVRRGGRLIVIARSDVEKSAKGKNWKRVGDGYCTPMGTFQKQFSTGEVIDLLQRLPDAAVMAPTWQGRKQYVWASAVKG